MTTYNQKHLTLDQRIIIQTGITNCPSLKSIAATNGKDLDRLYFIKPVQ